MASDRFLFNFCVLTLFFTWEQFCTYRLCHSATDLFFFLLQVFVFFFSGEGTRAALGIREADAP